MSIVLDNNITLPTNYNLLVNGTPVKKVVVNGVTVWEKMTRLSIENDQIRNYVTIHSDKPDEISVGTSDCGNHSGCPQFSNVMWYQEEENKEEESEDVIIYTIKPIEPYTSITATFHHAGGTVNEDDWSNCHINGRELKEGEMYTVENAQSIEMRLLVGTNGWKGHWKTEILVCMYDVTLM